MLSVFASSLDWMYKFERMLVVLNLMLIHITYIALQLSLETFIHDTNILMIAGTIYMNSIKQDAQVLL